MITIHIDAKDTDGTVKQIQKVLGGTISKRWGEYTLVINSEFAKGKIKFLSFDGGVAMLHYDIIFLDDITLIMDASEFNPIHFTYCLEGYCGHKFGYQQESEIKILEQFQSVIITSRDGGFNYGYFPKDLKLDINVIQVMREPFLKKRQNHGQELNKHMYALFSDTKCENVFAHFGTYNLKLADLIRAISKVKGKGMVRLMQIQGLAYLILATHMLQHSQEMENKKISTTLLKRELKLIRKYSKKIEKNVSIEYDLESISAETGLTQAKLQEGFKVLYGQTVTAFIRNKRLEAARDLISTTELSISEIVYTIGFSSRSYFSKIFKDKFNISPSLFKKNKWGQVKTRPKEKIT